MKRVRRISRFKKYIVNQDRKLSGKVEMELSFFEELFFYNTYNIYMS